MLPRSSEARLHWKRRAPRQCTRACCNSAPTTRCRRLHACHRSSQQELLSVAEATAQLLLWCHDDATACLRSALRQRT